jgi:hypothetical protein
METLRVEAVEASSGPGSQQSLNDPLIPASSSSATNTRPSKDKPMWLKSPMTKVRGRSAHKVGRSSQCSRANSNWFWWEIAAAISSILVIVGLVAILHAYNGHAAPSWPYGITVSTFIKPDFTRH